MVHRCHKRASLVWASSERDKVGCGPLILIAVPIHICLHARGVVTVDQESFHRALTSVGEESDNVVPKQTYNTHRSRYVAPRRERREIHRCAVTCNTSRKFWKRRKISVNLSRSSHDTTATRTASYKCISSVAASRRADHWGKPVRRLQPQTDATRLRPIRPDRYQAR